MYQKIRPLFLLCETPLHAGSGSDLGIVDLPIQRERHTSYPKIESSSLKGALREDFETNCSEIEISGEKFKINKDVDPNTHKAKTGSPLALAFGPEGDDSSNAHAGALGFTDARLLLFPVKSMKGVFAWITCPEVLERFVRDMRLAHGFEGINLESMPAKLADNECQANSAELDLSGHIILDEYAFKNKPGGLKVKMEGELEGTPLGQWLSNRGVGHQNPFWKEKLKNDIVILSNSSFKDFVNLSTEVITRTKIDNETGTVQKGGLFTEEYLPMESLLYCLVMSAPVFQPQKKKKDCLLQNEDDVMNFFAAGLRPVIQLGANATLGKGLLKTSLLSLSNKK